MTIEKELSRIADALELRNKLTVAPAADYVEQRKAEVVAEVGKNPTGPKKSAIKPPVEPVKETPPVVEEDFLGDPVEEKVPGVEEVRDAIVAYRAAKTAELGDVKGKEAAFTLLAKAGGGATMIASDKAGRPVGTPGVLEPKFYAAVLKAIAGK